MVVRVISRSRAAFAVGRALSRWALILAVLLVLSFGYLSSQARVRADDKVVVATVRVNTLEVSLFAPGPVTVGKNFQVAARVRNIGTTNIVRTLAVLRLPAAGLSLKGSPAKRIGLVPPGEVRWAPWMLRADATGNYVIMVIVRGIDQESGDQMDAGNTAVIEVVSGPAKGPRGTLPPYGGPSERGGVLKTWPRPRWRPSATSS